MSLLALSVLVVVGLSLLFVAVWRFARRIDNYSIVDVAWSYAFAPVAATLAWAGSGWLPRRLVFALLLAAWSVRLGTHLFRRIRHHHPKEDGRYVELRARWAGRLGREMLMFFQYQAWSVAVLSLIFLPVFRNATPSWHPLEWVAIGLWLVAWIGEATADAQLAAFARDPGHRGQVCRRGLWRYSRHPNYFFEWCTWVAFALFAAASPLGWLGLLGPAVILYLLLRVTGVPTTEAQSLRSRGDAYRRYQQTTSAFFPWFPRSEPSSASS